MSELYKALSIEDSLTTLESRFYEKEEIQDNGEIGTNS